MSGRRRSYTAAFRPITRMAKEIGIGEQLLRRWVARERAEQVAPAAADADERAELIRLRAENAELRMDREFLESCGLLRHGAAEPAAQPVEAVEAYLWDPELGYRF